MVAIQVCVVVMVVAVVIVVMWTFVTLFANSNKPLVAQPSGITTNDRSTSNDETTDSIAEEVAVASVYSGDSDPGKKR